MLLDFAFDSNLLVLPHVDRNMNIGFNYFLFSYVDSIVNIRCVY